jgi:ABC-type multidrug transport system ATPase subunit
LPRTKVMKVAHDVATAVGLGSSDVYKRNAGLLSGGMRRRLSIAISMLGAPGVLLLDEMTTGLDPSTRNGIWALVGAFATIDRAVIITTHMMIEADTLCNRIAIIKDGNLEVVASQQQLKNKYGSGYTLQLNLGRSSQLYQDRAMDFVHKYINEDAKLDHKQAKTLHVSLPRDQSIAKVFNAMYSPERTSEGCINQFLLQQSSLEDVFVALG